MVRKLDPPESRPPRPPSPRIIERSDVENPGSLPFPSHHRRAEDRLEAPFSRMRYPDAPVGDNASHPTAAAVYRILGKHDRTLRTLPSRVSLGRDLTRNVRSTARTKFNRHLNRGGDRSNPLQPARCYDRFAEYRNRCRRTCQVECFRRVHLSLTASGKLPADSPGNGISHLLADGYRDGVGARGAHRYRHGTGPG